MSLHPSQLNTEHRDKLAAAIDEAILAASAIEHRGGRLAVYHTGEIIDALGLVLASIAATSAVTSSAVRRRQFIDSFSNLLDARIRNLRSDAANASPSPFEPFALGGMQ